MSPTGQSLEAWQHTRRWVRRQREALQLQIADGREEDIVGTVDVKNMELYPDAHRLLLPCDNVWGCDPAQLISREQRPFYNRLSQAAIVEDEQPLDAVASDLLTYSGFETEGRIHFRHRPRLDFTYFHHDVKSRPDFGVFVDVPVLSYLVVVVGKDPYSAHDRESGLCGDMLASAINRYGAKGNDKLVFGVLLFRLHVTFYKAIFSRDYLYSLQTERTPLSEAVVTRFPAGGLSLDKHDSRRKVVLILNAIRLQIEQVVSTSAVERLE